LTKGATRLAFSVTSAAHDAVEKEEDQRIKSQEPEVIDFINCRWKMGFEWDLTFVKQNKTKRKQIYIYIHIGAGV
jgi:hypothetical protein